LADQSNNTDNTNDTGMTASVEDNSIPTAPRSGYSPEQQIIADSILAMDPINDVPSAAKSRKGGSMSLKATALPPKLRQEVEAQLALIPAEERAAMESGLVEAALQKNRPSAILAVGLGENALPYHREMFTIAREVETAHHEADRIQAELDAVDGFDMQRDAETGEAKPVPVPVLKGLMRQGAINRLNDLQYRVSLLVDPDGGHGPEAKRRLAAELTASVAAVHQQQEQVAIHAEAKTLAVEINRERRVRQLAEQMASFAQVEVK
jgi:hypothetical protein